MGFALPHTPGLGVEVDLASRITRRMHDHRPHPRSGHPFPPVGELDLESLQRLVEFQVASGVDGVAVFGFASEGFALTAAERVQILRHRHAQPACRSSPGSAPTAVREAVEQTRAAPRPRRRAAMVLPPYMVKPSQAQLVDFYGEVAARWRAAGHGAGRPRPDRRQHAGAR